MGTIKTAEIDIAAIPQADTIAGDEELLVIENSVIKRKSITDTPIAVATIDSVTGAITALSAGEATVAVGVSQGYHLHCFAHTQGNTDAKFYDYSGHRNDGTPGADLSVATMWGTAGFASTTNPSSSNTAIRFPSLNFDYLGGESLLVFWKGQVTPEGSDATVLGNTENAAQNSGLKIMSTSAGKVKVTAYQNSGSLSRFGGTTTAACFVASETHSFALAIDGTTGKHKFWVDGEVDAAYASGFLTLGTGGIIDTQEAVTFNLGTGATGSGSAGIATATQALIVLKGRAGLGCPGDIDTLVADIHRNPSRLVAADRW